MCFISNKKITSVVINPRVGANVCLFLYVLLDYQLQKTSRSKSVSVYARTQTDI